MSNLMLMLLVFSCGIFFGLIAGAFVVSRREDADDFDGGFSTNYRTDAPRAHTTIYSKNVTLEDEQ